MPIYLDDDPRCYGCGADYSQLGGRTIARMCGECGHAWETLTELVEHDFLIQMASSRQDPIEFWSEVPETPPKRRPADTIFSCPCCDHDF